MNIRALPRADRVGFVAQTTDLLSLLAIYSCPGALHRPYSGNLLIAVVTLVLKLVVLAVVVALLETRILSCVVRVLTAGRVDVCWRCCHLRLISGEMTVWQSVFSPFTLGSGIVLIFGVLLLWRQSWGYIGSFR